MLTPKRPINLIVLHHSATPPGRDVKVDEIRAWHKAKGWADIGYHDVIEIDGRIREGRDREQPGAHAQGHNAHSLGICIVGDGRKGFTAGQEQALRALLRHYRRMWPGIEIAGHRDLKGAKTLCPGFDVKDWLRDNGF